jgi:hypothetical protein
MYLFYNEIKLYLSMVGEQRMKARERGDFPSEFKADDVFVEGKERAYVCEAILLLDVVILVVVSPQDS